MSHRDIDVLIIVEHLSRELESALLLERELCSRGYSAVVVFKGWNEGPASCFFRPKIIVTPWCYDDKDVEALSAYRGGFPDGSFDIVDLHSEQVTTPDGLSFVLPSGRAKDAFHISWGPFFMESLLADGVSDKRICIAGSNRLDLLRDEYRYLGASKAELSREFEIDFAKHWILFVGNYSAAFMTDERVSELEARGLLNAGENRNLSHRAYKESLAWMEEAVRDSNLRDCEFIYRPHPSEPISEELESLGNKYEHFHIVKSRSIRDWFLNCDIDLNWCSTSSVEAAFAGLPVISLRPFEVPAHFRFDLLENIEQISSSSELRRMIRGVIDGNFKDINLSFVEAISRYYKVDSTSATKNIADAIADLLSVGKGRFSCNRRSFYCSRKVLGYVAKQTAYHLGVARKFPSWRILVDDHITHIELERKRNFINGKS
jgi:surface carbohydrate biosynthesis protein